MVCLQFLLAVFLATPPGARAETFDLKELILRVVPDATRSGGFSLRVSKPGGERAPVNWFTTGPSERDGLPIPLLTKRDGRVVLTNGPTIFAETNAVPTSSEGELLRVVPWVAVDQKQVLGDDAEGVHLHFDLDTRVFQGPIPEASVGDLSYVVWKGHGAEDGTLVFRSRGWDGTPMLIPVELIVGGHEVNPKLVRPAHSLATILFEFGSGMPPREVGFSYLEVSKTPLRTEYRVQPTGEFAGKSLIALDRPSSFAKDRMTVVVDPRPVEVSTAVEGPESPNEYLEDSIFVVPAEEGFDWYWKNDDEHTPVDVKIKRFAETGPELEIGQDPIEIAPSDNGFEVVVFEESGVFHRLAVLRLESEGIPGFGKRFSLKWESGVALRTVDSGGDGPVLEIDPEPRVRLNKIDHREMNQLVEAADRGDLYSVHLPGRRGGIWVWSDGFFYPVELSVESSLARGELQIDWEADLIDFVLRRESGEKAHRIPIAWITRWPQTPKGATTPIVLRDGVGVSASMDVSVHSLGSTRRMRRPISTVLDVSRIEIDSDWFERYGNRSLERLRHTSPRERWSARWDEQFRLGRRLLGKSAALTGDLRGLVFSVWNEYGHQRLTDPDSQGGQYFDEREIVFESALAYSRAAHTDELRLGYARTAFMSLMEMWVIAARDQGSANSRAFPSVLLKVAGVTVILAGMFGNVFLHVSDPQLFEIGALGLEASLSDVNPWSPEEVLLLGSVAGLATAIVGDWWKTGPTELVKRLRLEDRLTEIGQVITTGQALTLEEAQATLQKLIKGIHCNYVLRGRGAK